MNGKTNSCAICTKIWLKFREIFLPRKAIIFAKPIAISEILVYNIVVDVRFMVKGCADVLCRTPAVISTGVCPIFNRALSIRIQRIRQPELSAQSRIPRKRSTVFKGKAKKHPTQCFEKNRPPNQNKEAKTMAVKEKIRIRLKSYDHTLIDQAAQKIVETAKRNDAAVSGPIPLPTEREIITILRAVHKYKDSREQFELRTHKRLIDVIKPSQKTVEALMGLELPAGVEIEIKL